ncbi:MAG: hypothetical protein ACKO4U_12910, partial [Caldilinea sp.]
PPEVADALRKFLDAAPGQTQAERERQYLMHLCVNPDFHRWQQRDVALLQHLFSRSPGNFPLFPQLAHPCCL